MNKKRPFLLYHVHTLCEDMAYDDEEWRSSVTESNSVFCSECKSVLPGIGKINLRLTSIETKCAMNFSRSGVGILSKEVLSVFESSGKSQWLNLGEVVLNGTVNPRYFTFNCEKRITIRGGPESALKRQRREPRTGARYLISDPDGVCGWVCSACGAHHYFAMGNRYLLRAALGDSPPPVMGDRGSSLIVSEELAKELAARSFPKLCIEELPIIDEPQDGWGHPEF